MKTNRINDLEARISSLIEDNNELEAINNKLTDKLDKIREIIDKEE